MMQGVKNAHVSSTAAILAPSLTVVLMSWTTMSSANVYLEPKLKPLRHACGIVVDPYNRPIPNTKVEILGGAMEVSAVRTGEDGKFSFERLAAEHYGIRVEATGFHPESIHIVLVRPKTPAKRMLRIRLCAGIYEGPDIRIIKSK